MEAQGLSHALPAAGGYTLIMSRYAALREHGDTTNADHIIVLHDLTSEDYERLLEIRKLRLFDWGQV